MEFVIDQNRFLSALTLAQSVADRKATMPILANVLLQATSEGLVCSATDMMIALVQRVEAEVTGKGSLTLGVRHLHGVVKTLPAGDITVTSLDNHWARIVAGRSEFKLMGMPQADFPELPEPKGVAMASVPAQRLLDLVQKTLFSVSTDEARVNLNGALFECDGKKATMVSTDGHRLTRASHTLAGPVLADGIIIPRKGLLEMRKVLEREGGDIDLGVADQHLFVRSEGLTLSIKLNAVSFPPYRQVIPGAHERRAVVGRSELLGALRQAEVMAPEKTATVRVQLQDESLHLTADNPDLGVSNLELPLEYEGGPLTAGFNAHYLIEAIEAIDTERVQLLFQGELDPCVIKPLDGPDFLAVVMPMRI